MKIFKSSQNALRISGNESLATLHDRNASRNVGQPLLVRISAARPPKRTTDAATLMPAPCRPLRRRSASRTARRSLGSGEGRGTGGVAEPLVVDLLELARRLQRRDRLRHARRQRRALRQQRAPLVATGRVELADDLRALHLRSGHVEG